MNLFGLFKPTLPSRSVHINQAVLLELTCNKHILWRLYNRAAAADLYFILSTSLEEVIRVLQIDVLRRRRGTLKVTIELRLDPS